MNHKLRFIQGGPKVSSLRQPNWVLPEKIFAVSSENTGFQKKLFNMKIFSIKFVIKKGYVNFWRKMTPFSKKMFMALKIFGQTELTFGLPCMLSNAATFTITALPVTQAIYVNYFILATKYNKFFF